MKPQTSNRSIRIIFAALLTSGLSDPELEEVADDLVRGGEISRQAGTLLRDTLTGPISSPGESTRLRHQETFHPPEKTGNPMVDEAIEIIKRRRLSKVAIVKAMGAVNPDLKHSFMGQLNLSVRDLLLQFSSLELPDKFFEFLEILDGRNKKQDEYLKGIMRSKEK